MNRVSLISMTGGVGRSTLTAALATSLARLLGDHRVGVLDLDPAAMLEWHLGSASPSAVARLALDIDRQGSLPSLETSDNDPLAQAARAAGLAHDAVVLIDSAAGPTPSQQMALAHAGHILAVMTPDPACCATLPALQEVLEQSTPSAQCHVVLNRVDPRNRLNDDLRRMIEDRFADRMAPLPIHRDEGIREALALQQTCLSYDPHSQASHDIDQLSRWLLTQIDTDLDL